MIKLWPNCCGCGLRFAPFTIPNPSKSQRLFGRHLFDLFGLVESPWTRIKDLFRLGQGWDIRDIRDIPLVKLWLVDLGTLRTQDCTSSEPDAEKGRVMQGDAGWKFTIKYCILQCKFLMRERPPATCCLDSMSMCYDDLRCTRIWPHMVGWYFGLSENGACHSNGRFKGENDDQPRIFGVPHFWTNRSICVLTFGPPLTTSCLFQRLWQQETASGC